MNIEIFSHSSVKVILILSLIFFVLHIINNLITFFYIDMQVQHINMNRNWKNLNWDNIPPFVHSVSVNTMSCFSNFHLCHLMLLYINMENALYQFLN